jgi:hypothetical protein
MQRKEIAMSEGVQIVREVVGELAGLLKGIEELRISRDKEPYITYGRWGVTMVSGMDGAMEYLAPRVEGASIEVERGPDLEEADRVRDEAYDEAYAEDVGPESHAEARARAVEAAEDAYQKYMEEHDGD